MGATDGIVCRPVEVVLRPGEMDAGRVDGALTFSAALLLLGGRRCEVACSRKSWTFPLMVLALLSAWSLPENWRAVLHLGGQLVLAIRQHL